MPVIRSARKKLRADRKRASANKKKAALIDFFVKKTTKKPSPKNVQEAFKIIDKGIKRNVIHKNKAARIKSRLSKLLNKRDRTVKKTKEK